MTSATIRHDLPSFLPDDPPLIAAIQEGLALVEAELRLLVKTGEPSLAAAVHNTISRPGKRLRPLLGLLGSLALHDGLAPAVIRGAAAVEALHLASLIHDDLIDGAPIRSGRPTAHISLGSQAAVLLGDFFFARALQGAAGIGRSCLRRFLRTAEDLVAGEFAQAAEAYILPRPEDYLAWIKAKTASLFALAATPGRMAHRNLDRYGRALGLAYQLQDDLLDLIAVEGQLGKPVLSDCRRGIYTFPLLAACAREPAAASRLKEMAWGGAPMDREMLALLQRTGAIEETLEVCRYWTREALSSLNGLPFNGARRALAGLADWIGSMGRDNAWPVCQ